MSNKNKPKTMEELKKKVIENAKKAIENQETKDYEEGENAAKIGETCPTSASTKFKEGFKKKEEEIKNNKKNPKMKK